MTQIPSSANWLGKLEDAEDVGGLADDDEESWVRGIESDEKAEVEVAAGAPGIAEQAAAAAQV